MPRAPVCIAALVACSGPPGGRAPDATSPTDGPVDVVPTPDPTLTTVPVTGCVTDVPGRFAALATDPAPEQYLSAINGGVLPWPRYTDSAANSFGFLEHFQGLQRIGRYLLVSGGVAYGPPTSQLILVEMGSRGADETWAPPAGGPAFVPAPEDAIVATFDLDPTLWHAGGIQVADGIVAVPLAGDDVPSELRFYDLSDLSAPRELAPRVVRDHDLYVAALTRMPDGRFLALWWDDVVMELTFSLTSDLDDGLDETSALIVPADVAGGFQEGGCGVACGTYQAMNLVRDCGGPLFLVATRNSEKLSPTIPGDNLASLYELGWAGGEPTMSLVDRREFACHDRQCNFAAASGVAVLGDDLALYGAYHWLQDDGTRLLFQEFAAP